MREYVALMRVYVCMCMCVYVCMHVCVCVYTYANVLKMDLYTRIQVLVTYLSKTESLMRVLHYYRDLDDKDMAQRGERKVKKTEQREATLS